MLVLSRHKDERIVIGEGLITLTIVDIRGDKVRVGIEAPKNVSVHRNEVFEAIARNRNTEGSRPDGSHGSAELVSETCLSKGR
jgi:carbon storage regulator